jgi:hypothetical protein
MTRREGLKIGLFCLLGGLCFTLGAVKLGNFGWWYLSGVLMTASLVPVLRFGPRNMLTQFGAIAMVLVVVGLGCTLSEAVVFFPEQKAQMMQSFVGGAVSYVLAAAVLVALTRLMKIRDGSEGLVTTRSAAMTVPLFLAAGASYVVYYEIFGAITYQYFTKQYYPHAAEQVYAMGPGVFIGYQLMRGLLMTIAVLMVIYTLRLPRWQAAVCVGLMVWVVGGAGPLLVPNAMMSATQRFIHIVEIMTQNVSLGVTAVWLLRAKAGVAVEKRDLVHTA